MMYGVTEYFEEQAKEKFQQATNNIKKGYQYPEQTPGQSDLGTGRGAIRTSGMQFNKEALV